MFFSSHIYNNIYAVFTRPLSLRVSYALRSYAIKKDEEFNNISYGINIYFFR